MAKYDNSDGVWRTVGGRRIFIKKGQSLSDAMKESGKFKVTGKIGGKDLTPEQMVEFDKQANELEKELKEKYMNIPQEERVKAYEDGKNWKDLVEEKTQNANLKQAQMEYEHAQDKFEHYKFNGADDEDRIKYKKLKDDAYDKYVKTQREYDEARLKTEYKSRFANDNYTAKDREAAKRIVADELGIDKKDVSLLYKADGTINIKDNIDYNRPNKSGSNTKEDDFERWKEDNNEKIASYYTQTYN